MGSHFDAKRACPIEHALFLHFDWLNVPSKVEGLKVSDRAQEARRNGLKPAERLIEGPESFLMSAWFYILRLQSGSLYPGATADLKQRYEEYNTKRACRTTTLDPPIALVYSEEYETFSEARLRESQVKRWSRSKKEALVAGDLATLRNLARSK
jgi:predicted GIY-YIG superfamily endonuclease